MLYALKKNIVSKTQLLEYFLNNSTKYFIAKRNLFVKRLKELNYMLVKWLPKTPDLNMKIKSFYSFVIPMITLKLQHKTGRFYMIRPYSIKVSIKIAYHFHLDGGK